MFRSRFTALPRLHKSAVVSASTMVKGCFSPVAGLKINTPCEKIEINNLEPERDVSIGYVTETVDISGTKEIYNFLNYLIHLKYS